MISSMIYLVLIVVGLSLGSFINALIWRLHKQAEYVDAKKRPSKVEQDKLSITKGRSMCLHCGHELAPRDLIPVISWVWLRGRCRYCKAPIDDTPLAELLMPALLLLSWVAWPFGTMTGGYAIGLFVIWALILTCFVALALYDAKWYLLPDRIVLPLTLLAALFTGFSSLQQHDASVLLWSALGALTLSGIFWFMSVASKGAWIGWGDVKLGVALGLLAGTPLMALLVLFVASITGSLLTLPQIFRGKEGLRTSLPFGPHLIAATILIVLYGEAIFAWYFGLLTGS